MGLFKEFDEREDSFVIRGFYGIHFLAVTLFGVGLIVALGAFPIAFLASGSDRDDLMLVGIVSLVAVVVGLLLRVFGPSTVIDFESEEILDGGSRYPFSDVACVAITESLQVVRTKNSRQELPFFHVVLGIGKVDAESMGREIKKVLDTDTGDEFIAARSSHDEDLLQELLIEMGLERIVLLRTGSYPVVWRLVHRLATASEAALLNLTGSKFTVAHGSDVNLSLPERLAERGHEARGDHGVVGVRVERTPGGLELAWDYSLWLPILLTVLVGVGASVIGFFEDEVLGMILLVVFGIPTLLIVSWLVLRTGTHRLRIDDERISYFGPYSGRPKAIPLDDLTDVYMRPNVSGGMSLLLLLGPGKPIVVRGKLPALKAVDDLVRSHFASKGGQEEVGINEVW